MGILAFGLCFRALWLWLGFFGLARSLLDNAEGSDGKVVFLLLGSWYILHAPTIPYRSSMVNAP